MEPKTILALSSAGSSHSDQHQGSGSPQWSEAAPTHVYIVNTEGFNVTASLTLSAWGVAPGLASVGGACEQLIIWRSV